LLRRYREPQDLPSFPTRRSSDLEGQRALRGLAHARHGLARRHVQVREVVVRVGQAGVREGVSRIALDGLVEVVDAAADRLFVVRSEEHTSELQSLAYIVCRLLLG